MRRFALSLMSIWVMACGGDDAAPGGDGGGDGDGGGATTDGGVTVDAPPIVGEPPGLEGTTAAHNAERALVGVGPLTWDPALAAIADGWVRRCVDQQAPAGLVDHNANRSQGQPTYVGENIYGSSGSASGTAAVASWVSEKQYYHYPANTCDANRVCGHYTQVVWRATTRVGCALYRCPGLQYGSTVVCNYGPGGNSGGLPY